MASDAAPASSSWAAPRVAAALEGVIDLEHAPDGSWFMPWRLPVADLELHHPALVLPAMSACGARIRVRTAARGLRLDAGAVRLDGGPGFPGVCDLLFDGDDHNDATPAVPTGPAAPATGLWRQADLGQSGPGAVFEDLPPGEKLLELWLPTLAPVRVRGLHALDGAALLPAPPDRRPRWTVYGSSITHGFAVPPASPAATWPAVAARLLGRNVTNLGFGGACLLDPLVARMIGERATDHITMEIGINIHNTAALRERTLAPSLHGFLATIRSLQSHVPITVLGPVHGGEREDSVVACRRNPDGSGVEVEGDLTLRQMRSIFEEVVTLLQRRGDRALTWVDGRELFSAQDAAAGGLSDGLHPDVRSQGLMGERFAAREGAR
ncbi:GDSL-type esterase/lipase family protein [Streptacidiphilus carbonis]|uniref:GDSL-type esterase/lipase family protein n=1 Tax=Streptacidiphilus carbonis TaxID=105422 RepID=UPI00069375B6|nr:SGNH/GDSL hydrolase family protein [Streptacidiphilus carbonis]